MSAILFGSISTLADTSELQRRAFNEAFAAYGLDWTWSQQDYQSMLGSSGGAARVQKYADQRGEDIDAAAVHAKKSAIFQELLAASEVTARPGVLEVIDRAKDDGHQLGLVTTTSGGNVAALLTALGPDIDASTFDVIVDVDSVADPKPDPAAYRYALDQLGRDESDVVAIEDNTGGVRAAAAAGIACVAFPNVNTTGGDFDDAADTVDALDPARILGLTQS